MKPGIFAKGSIFIGGGGGSRSPSMREVLYEANHMIQTKYTKDKDGLMFNVLKDRYGGEIGQLSMKEAITLISKILAEMKFGSNHMFQESLSLKIEETLNEILMTNNNCIPSSEAIKKYLEGNEK